MDFSQQWDDYILSHEASIERSPRDWFEYARIADRHTFKPYFMRLLNLWSDTMARGKTLPTAKKQSTQSASWTQFVNIPVSAEDEPKMRAAYPSSAEVYGAMEDLLVGGYRISFNYDAQRDAIICAVTCKSEGNPNVGKTFTSFAGDWYTALTVSCYKHFQVTDEVWDAGGTAAQRPVFG